MSTPSAALSAGGQFGGGIAGFFQARRAASQAKEQARIRARAIERQGFRELGAARAALGKSGVRIDAATPFDVQFDVLLEFERAAAQELFEGQLAAFRLRQQGLASLTSGIFGAASTGFKSFDQSGGRGTIADSGAASGSGSGSGGGGASGGGGGGAAGGGGAP